MLQSTPGVTSHRLAAKLGVSERATRRYIAILREAGIPVASARGPYGGYRIGRGPRVPPVLFTDEEALALVMAVLEGHHDAADSELPVGRAIDKLLRALPESVSSQADAVRRSTSATPDRGGSRPDPATTADLVHACSNSRQVRIDYRSEAGSRFDAIVDPWAVVVRHGRWYLLCRSHQADAPRAYRVDRIGHVEVLDESCDIPEDLDPVATLERHLASGWEFETEVRIEAPVEEAARHLPPRVGQLQANDDGSSTLTGSSSNLAWYVAYLCALPMPYRIVKGPELRETAQTIADRLLAATAAPVG